MLKCSSVDYGSRLDMQYIFYHFFLVTLKLHIYEIWNGKSITAIKREIRTLNLKRLVSMQQRYTILLFFPN